MNADLHLHTTASDGSLPPEELVGRACEAGMDVIAITDHDTVSGFAKAKESAPKSLQVIPGAEISAGEGYEVHVLGLGLEPSPGIEGALKDMREERVRRMDAMLDKLSQIGVEIQRDEVLGLAKGAVGRGHVAQALVRRGAAPDIRQAFAKYLSPGKPGYVPRQKVTVEQAIALILRYGGLPVLAHPGLLPVPDAQLPILITHWRKLGLMGVEAYHPSHTPAQMQAFDKLARKQKLLVSGGSDFHGSLKPHIQIGQVSPVWRSMDSDIKQILKALGRL